MAAGLTTRPLDATIRDTFAWDAARGGPQPGQEGLPDGREAQLLARFTETSTHLGTTGTRPEP